jgi:nucleotide-binding universal stress UspA family protein
MDTTTQDAVVVGVTGPGRETAALRFAVEVARRDGLEIVLVHAFRTALTGPPPSALLTTAETADLAHWVVKEVEEELASMTDGDVRHRGLAIAGTPAHVLADLSRGARLVVVQHRALHTLRRLFVGSTSNGVAAHADCPVVSIPTGWVPGEGPDPGEVVVGVHERGLPRPALKAGFEWAAATGAPLRVVHAWRLDAVYDDIITDRVAAQWREEQRRVLDAAVQGMREHYPGVTVIIEVRHQWPTEVLVDDSRVASLVVVGRHGPHGWEPQHLGSLARTVLRESKCPVMVVPVRRHEDAADDWELLADEVSPQL